MHALSPAATVTPAVHIRPIAVSDNPRVAEIIRLVMTDIGCGGEGFSIHDPEVNRMFEAYDTPRAAFFVAELAGEVIGGAGIAPLKGGDAQVCELQKMYMLPAGRGLGIGKALMEQCLNSARRLGYRQCYLETLASLSEACALYQRSGFRMIPAPMGRTGHDSCNHFMLRDL